MRSDLGGRREHEWIYNLYTQECVHFACGQLNLDLWDENVTSSADENTAVDL